MATSGTAPAAPATRKKIRRPVTAPLAGVLAAGLFAAGLYYRSHRATALTDKDTVVVADFANTTGDAVFDDTLKTVLIIALNQSPFLDVLAERNHQARARVAA